jgi:hypothetical protein
VHIHPGGPGESDFDTFGLATRFASAPIDHLAGVIWWTLSAARLDPLISHAPPSSRMQFHKIQTPPPRRIEAAGSGEPKERCLPEAPQGGAGECESTRNRGIGPCRG